MHESLLLTYFHIPSVFHNQRPYNGYCELYSGWNIDFTLKTTAQQDCFFISLVEQFGLTELRSTFDSN